MGIEPTVGRIVHYRLTRADAKVANNDKVRAHEHLGQFQATGVQMHEGNQHRAGDVVPLLVVRVWPDEYDPGARVCRDYVIGQPDDFEWQYPLSSFGVNGQAFLDGSDVLWITSAPEGQFNGAWSWSDPWTF